MATFTGTDVGKTLTPALVSPTVKSNPRSSVPSGAADTIYGNSGDDTYVVDNTGDFVFEGLSAGVDRVNAWVNYTLGNNILAMDHSSDFLTEPWGAGSGSATSATSQEENDVPGGAGDNPAAIPGAAFNQAGCVQDNQLSVKALASEASGDLFSSLPIYSINQIADYIKEGWWDWFNSGSRYRSFDMGDSFTTGNNGVLYYNYSGFSGIWFAGTDTDGLSAARRALVDEALDYLGEILGINFVATTNQTDYVDLFFKDNDNKGAYSSASLYSTGNGTSNHRYVDYAWVNVPADWSGGTSGIDTYQTFIHETLHCLGLGHPGPYNSTEEDPYGHYITDTSQATTNNNNCLNDSWQMSIMSYFNQDENTTIDADFNFVITPMAADFEVLHDYYGSSYYGSLTFAGDTIYGFNTNIAATTSQVMADLQLYADETAFCLIDDGGIDTVDFSGYTADQKIDLRTRSGSSTTGSISDIGGKKGNMTIAVGTEIENAIGGSGDDTIWGNNTYNILKGGAGNDSIDGGGGNDTFYGGDGNDTLDGIYGGINIMYGEEGNDTLWGYSSNDTLFGGAGNDTLHGDRSNDYLDGGAGNDTMDGSYGDDTYVVDSSLDVVTEPANGGTDQVNAYANYTLSANVENLDLYGTATSGTGNALNNNIVGNSNANSLSGLGGNDTLFGFEGNDTLNGGPGSDAMYGGLGNDIYTVDNTSDFVSEGSTSWEGVSGGLDKVNAFVNYTLSVNIENLSLFGTATNGTGNELTNGIYGNGNDNSLFGLGGNDMLVGGPGNDYLDGGSGSDLMGGGTGNDAYMVDNVSDGVVEAVGEGIDRVNAYINYTLGANVENLYLLGTALNGTGNALNNYIDGNSNANSLSGLGGNDSLHGEAGNDTLNGGPGNDFMSGGTGDDTYAIDNTLDEVIEAASAGTDRINAYVNYTLSDNVENLYLYGTALNGTGNALDNVIVGNGNANTLLGYDGNDTLNGDTGNDTMAGGTGNDTYIVDSAGDVVFEAAGIYYGTDKVNAYVNYTLGGNVENLSLLGTALNGTGNVLNNVIVGNSNANILSGLAGNDSLSGNAGNDNLDGGDGNDTLDGGTGNDSMAGGAGDDTYVVDSASDAVIEAAAAGSDRINAYVNYAPLGDNVENLYLYGTALGGYGNSLNNVIVGNSYWNTLEGRAGNDNIFGNAGDDFLHGEDGNDYLNGSDGNDRLHGGAGSDTMVGGTGDDTYDVDNAGDMVSEAAGAGNDSVNAFINYTLGANVEVLALQGTATNGIGNTLNNIIIGNNNANVLSGLAGNDTLSGTGDYFGIDGNDSLSGGDGNDSLYGYGGNDILNGGAGLDFFKFGESGLANVDTISDFAHADDTIGLRDSLDGSFNDAIQGLVFSLDGVLSAARYFEGAGNTGNGYLQASGIYNDTSTGTIYYNPTSFTMADAVVICTVGAATAASLDNTDFMFSA